MVCIMRLEKVICWSAIVYTSIVTIRTKAKTRESKVSYGWSESKQENRIHQTHSLKNNKRRAFEDDMTGRDTSSEPQDGRWTDIKSAKSQIPKIRTNNKNINSTGNCYRSYFISCLYKWLSVIICLEILVLYVDVTVILFDGQTWQQVY